MHSNIVAIIIRPGTSNVYAGNTQDPELTCTCVSGQSGVTSVTYAGSTPDLIFFNQN